MLQFLLSLPRLLFGLKCRNENKPTLESLPAEWYGCMLAVDVALCLTGDTDVKLLTKTKKLKIQGMPGVSKAKIKQRQSTANK